MSTASTSLRRFVSAPPSRWGRAVDSWNAVLVAAVMIVYLLLVVAANIASVRWPPLVVEELVVPAGTVFAGASLTVRDLVHETIGARGAAVGIVAGAGLSAVFASPRIAVASVVAFAASEIVDALIYARLRHRSRLRAIAVSNAGGLVVDSVLFVPLAFGSFIAVPGQLVGKGAATLLSLAVLQVTTVAARWVVNHR